MVLAFAAIVVTGTLVGTELGVAVVNRSLGQRLAEGALVPARASGAETFGRIMPGWYAGAVALCAALLLSSMLEERPQGGVWLVSAVAFLAAAVALSVIVLVPINNRARAWSATAPPDDWRERLRRWDRWHLLRVVVILAGFCCLVVGTVR